MGGRALAHAQPGGGIVRDVGAALGRVLVEGSELGEARLDAHRRGGEVLLARLHDDGDVAEAAAFELDLFRFGLGRRRNGFVPAAAREHRDDEGGEGGASSGDRGRHHV